MSAPRLWLHDVLTAYQRREKRRVLFEALGRGLEQIAQQRATIICVEDIHWVDPTSRELLETIVQRVNRLPLTLCNGRGSCRLHASLMARLDRLGPAREIAKIAAALAREFPFDLLRVITVDRRRDELQANLQQLISAELSFL